MVDYSRFDNIDCSSSDDESDAAQTVEQTTDERDREAKNGQLPPPPPPAQQTKDGQIRWANHDEGDRAANNGQLPPPPPPAHEEMTQEQEIERVIRNVVRAAVGGDIQYLMDTLSFIPKLDDEWRAAWRARGGLDALGYDPRHPESEMMRVTLEAGCANPALWLDGAEGVAARAK